MTMNTSTAPLLQPPPQDITDKVLTRQWMENIYRYLYQQTVSGNASLATLSAQVATNTTDITTNLSESVQVVTVSVSDTLTVAGGTAGGQPLVGATVVGSVSVTVTLKDTSGNTISTATDNS